MEIIVCKDNNELSYKASEFVTDIVNRKENPVLGLATGSTPEKLYELLIKKINREMYLLTMRHLSIWMNTSVWMQMMLTVIVTLWTNIYLIILILIKRILIFLMDYPLTWIRHVEIMKHRLKLQVRLMFEFLRLVRIDISSLMCLGLIFP